jgi:hypothetical protein
MFKRTILSIIETDHDNQVINLPEAKASSAEIIEYRRGENVSHKQVSASADLSETLSAKV